MRVGQSERILRTTVVKLGVELSELGCEEGREGNWVGTTLFEAGMRQGVERRVTDERAAMAR